MASPGELDDADLFDFVDEFQRDREKGRELPLAHYLRRYPGREEAIARVSAGVLGTRAAPFVFPYGPPTVRKVGLCSGAAGDLLEAAVAAGCDMFVTGELAERAGELARELQITLVAAGHYATEVFGPSRVADELRRQFPALSVHFVPVATPL